MMEMDHNQLTVQALSLDRPKPPMRGATPVQVGCFYTEHSDILLHVYAPESQTVSVILSFGARQLSLSRDADGLFKGMIPYDPTIAGPLYLDVLFDKTPALYPHFPITWCGDRPINYVEMPSPSADLWALRDVPHGTISRELYYSGVMHGWKRCMVYTPPSYTRDAADYPVVYMLHGGTANELDWICSGRIAQLFDNLFAEGRAVPFLAVMTNGMVRFSDSGNVVWDNALEQMLIHDVIPYMDTHYRTKTGKWDRALCGLSMGAYMTNDIGFRHPELFGYIGQFTACMTHRTDRPNYERPYLNLMQEWEKDPSEFARRYRVFFRSTTYNEDHFDYFETDDAIISKAGIDQLPCNCRIVYPKETSKWDSWRLGVRDYVQLLFR